MKKLEQLVDLHQANTRPVDTASIQNLERKLGFGLSDEYKLYLSIFGVIVFDAYETYGLGVPEDYYLNVGSAFDDLSRDPTYPKNTVPVLEIGDGQYYLYDNKSRQVLLWSSPNGGVIRVLDEDLESFLIKHIFTE
jgi:hypothetical protein